MTTKEKKKKESSVPKVTAVFNDDLQGEIKLKWNHITGTHLYIIQICIYSNKLNWMQVDIITRSSYLISGLKSGKKYGFRVSAVSASGRGRWSEVIVVNAP